MYWSVLGILLAIYEVHAVITTKPQNLVVNEGETVELPCNIKDIQKDAVVVWKRGDEVLFLDEYSEINDQRFQMHRENDNFTLIIDRVGPYDAALYVCSITSPEMSISFRIQVNVRPSVSISPDSNPLLLNIGENVALKCSVSGNPIPNITWARQNNQIPERASVKAGQLRIMRVSADDSGVYECTASNGVGADVKDTIELRVQSGGPGSHELLIPWVDTDYPYISTKLDQDVNISCKYNAEPSPQVDWFYNAFPINLSDEKFKGTIQYGARRENYSESILAIRNIKEDNFGDYSCRVSNNLGTMEKTIHVSGRPGPPSLNVTGSTLSWTVQSVDPIIEYEFLYRTPTDDTWQHTKHIRASKDDQDGDIWTHSEELGWLKAGFNYELQVKARNALGWGSLARSYALYMAPTSNVTNAEKPSSVGRLSVPLGILSTLIIILLL